MPKTRTVGGVAALVLAASGCGLFPASSERDVVVPANPTMIGYVDPSAIDGLVTMTMTEGEDAARRVHIRYPQLESAPTLNEALRQEAQRQLLAFRATAAAWRPTTTGRPNQGGADGSVGADTAADGNRTADTDTAADGNRTADTNTAAGADRIAGEDGAARPELNVDWQLVAASPDVIGVRLRTGQHVGVDCGRSTRTLWYDRRRDVVTGSAGLLSGQVTLDHLTRMVREGLAGRGAAVDRGRVTADPELFDSMAFNRNGDLVVEFDDCQIGSCALGRVAVAVPTERVVSWLSATGRRAQLSPRAAGMSLTPGPVGDPFEGGAPFGGLGVPAGFGSTVTAPRAGAPDPAAPRAGAPHPAAPRAGASGPAAPQAQARRPGSGGSSARVPGATAPGSAGRSERVDCAVAKCVALTFNDGPGPETPRLLDMLRDLGARATFFVVGANATADPWLLGRMAGEGHEIGNHSWTHRDLSQLSASKVLDSLGRTQDLIAVHAGRKPVLARAPYGAVSEEVRDAAHRLGLTLVGWDVNTVAPTETTGVSATGRPTAETIARRAVAGARDGAVIQLHDTSGAAVDATPAIVGALRGKGYALVTVAELYGDSGSRPEPGEGSAKAAAPGRP
ncbi:polysaccharide deacetylase family protein [Nonomuraea indica]|uniref:Polysaccharide deacetylase family protein n=1 Tax=Nonomuraea indica TaxID=1581193 RepID=A0ABW7ZV19_9ACTN